MSAAVTSAVQAIAAIGAAVVAIVLLDSALRWWSAFACIRAQRAALEEVE